jgi:tRNA G10  N-methylase Trm11
MISTTITNRNQNKLQPIDRSAHDWYRFVLSYPPHLVRKYLNKFNIDETKRVLDPFCGTGTTLVECKKMGIPSVGIEANPMAYFASRIKTKWDIKPDDLLHHAEKISKCTLRQFKNDGIDDQCNILSQPQVPLKTLIPEQMKLLLTNSISPLPLHKVLVLLEQINAKYDKSLTNYELLALAKALILNISNLHFGPEVGVGTLKVDTSVISAWMDNITEITTDIQELSRHSDVPSIVHYADSRQMTDLIQPNSIDAVITSPPYPNEKDYTRTTRLESVLLGFIKNKEDLRTLKQGLVRSNTRNVYVNDHDDLWVEKQKEIQRIAEAIEDRRISLGKTSGFERLYARVTKLYFGGMSRHLASLRSILHEGAYLAYVVGDQASYLRVMIRTGTILAEIAQTLGYEVVGIDLFRTRRATATREELREEVVLLRWPKVKKYSQKSLFIDSDQKSSSLRKNKKGKKNEQAQPV